MQEPGTAWKKELTARGLMAVAELNGGVQTG